MDVSLSVVGTQRRDQSLSVARGRRADAPCRTDNELRLIPSAPDCLCMRVNAQRQTRVQSQGPAEHASLDSMHLGEPCLAPQFFPLSASYEYQRLSLVEVAYKPATNIFLPASANLLRSRVSCLMKHTFSHIK